MRYLEQLLSNPEMSKDINKFAQLDSYIQQGHQQWMALPEWKKAVTPDPALAKYIQNKREKDEKGNELAYDRLDPKYDLYGENGDIARINILSLVNIHNPFTLEEFEKMLDKSKPAKDQIDVSRNKAYSIAMSVWNELSDGQRNDLLEQSMYGETEYGNYLNTLRRYGTKEGAYRSLQKNVNDASCIKEIQTKQGKGIPLTDIEKDILLVFNVQRKGKERIDNIINKYTIQTHKLNKFKL